MSPQVIEKKHVWRMFDQLASRYDRMNRILSAYQDVRWRKKLVQTIANRAPECVVDVATGTADVLISLAKQGPPVAQAIGIDPSKEMVAIGQKKLQQLGLSQWINLQSGVATELPFDDNTVSVITMAFGIRNVADYKAALKEMVRVLGTNTTRGEALILEFSIPPWPLKPFYLLYFRYILPLIGRLFSGHPTAYRYLNQTVESFPYGDAFVNELYTAGFTSVTQRRLSCGIVTIYHARL